MVLRGEAEAGDTKDAGEGPDAAAEEEEEAEGPLLMMLTASTTPSSVAGAVACGTVWERARNCQFRCVRVTERLGAGFGVEIRVDLADRSVSMQAEGTSSAPTTEGLTTASDSGVVDGGSRCLWKLEGWRPATMAIATAEASRSPSIENTMTCRVGMGRKRRQGPVKAC